MTVPSAPSSYCFLCSHVVSLDGAFSPSSHHPSRKDAVSQSLPGLRLAHDGGAPVVAADGPPPSTPVQEQPPIEGHQSGRASKLALNDRLKSMDFRRLVASVGSESESLHAQNLLFIKSLLKQNQDLEKLEDFSKSAFPLVLLWVSRGPHNTL